MEEGKWEDKNIVWRLRRDDPREGGEEAHLSTSFIYLFFLMPGKPLLSLYNMPDTVLGTARTGVSTADLIPALIEFVVYQEGLTF